MANIILSCGHQVEDFDHAYNVTIKSSDRAGEKALSFMVVCRHCEEIHRTSGNMFESEEAGLQWLQTKRW